MRLTSAVVVFSILCGSCTYITEETTASEPAEFSPVRIPDGLDATRLLALLPTQESMEALLGVTFEVETTAGLSQSFEHTDEENLVGAQVRLYRSRAGVIRSAWVAPALYESASDAQAAIAVVVGELEGDPDAIRQEFGLGALADESRGAVIDSDASFTWALCASTGWWSSLSPSTNPTTTSWKR